jgi:hypothetical protein
MVSLGILKEVSGRSRRRVFLHERYFKMFDDSEIEALELAPHLVEETIAG